MKNDKFYVEDSWHDWQMAKDYNCPNDYLDVLESEYLRRFNAISSVTYATFDELEKLSIPMLPRITE